MSRRTSGPKRRAEAYAQRTVLGAWDWAETQLIRRIAALAYMAGYRSAARARRNAPIPAILRADFKIAPGMEVIDSQGKPIGVIK